MITIEGHPSEFELKIDSNDKQVVVVDKVHKVAYVADEGSVRMSNNVDRFGAIMNPYRNIKIELISYKVYHRQCEEDAKVIDELNKKVESLEGLVDDVIRTRDALADKLRKIRKVVRDE